MHWIAPSGKDTDITAQEMCLWDAAGQLLSASGRGTGGEGLAAEYSGEPSRELSIQSVEKTDETGRLCRLNLAVQAFEGEIKHGRNVNTVSNFEIVLPPCPLMQHHDTFAHGNHKQCEILLRRIQTLHRTRDLRLPRLLSGQVEFKQEAA